MSTKEQMLADNLFTAMEKAVLSAVAPLKEKIAVLEEQVKSFGKPENGKDGRGLKKAQINRKGELCLIYSDGEVDELGVVVGKDGQDGEKGIDGENGDMPELPDIDKMVQAAVKKAVKALPKPKDGIDGKDGADGKSVDLDAFEAELDAKIKSLIPDPVPGKDGKDGKNGKDGLSPDAKALKESMVKELEGMIPDAVNGKDGKDGISPELPDIEKMVADAVKSIPAPENGKDGLDGKDADPVDIDAVKAEIVKELAPTLKDTLDGMAKDLAKDYYPVSWRGKYSDDVEYEKGNIVTHAGAMWVSKKDGQHKINDKAAWHLVVKRPAQKEAAPYDPKPVHGVDT